MSADISNDDISNDDISNDDISNDDISNDELREMVRASIARAAGAASDQPSAVALHASFARVPVLASGDAEGRCLIEPAVRCNHCGYCLSYGH